MTINREAQLDSSNRHTRGAKHKNMFTKP